MKLQNSALKEWNKQESFNIMRKEKEKKDIADTINSTLGIDSMRSFAQKVGNTLRSKGLTDKKNKSKN